MRFLPLFILLIAVGCTLFKKAPPKKPMSKVTQENINEDEKLKKLLNKKFSKNGKFTTVSNDDVTIEKYSRADGQTILTLENGELRTETLTEKGTTITRTWQDGNLTGLTVGNARKTTLVTLDKDGKFTQKIITEKGKRKAICVEYEGEMMIRTEENDCAQTLSGFE